MLFWNIRTFPGNPGLWEPWMEISAQNRWGTAHRPKSRGLVRGSIYYPDLHLNFRNQEWLCERALLTPTNMAANCINVQLLQKLQGEVRCYNSVDTITEQDQVTHYPTEFLNSLEPPGVGVTKPIFSVPLFPQFFQMIKAVFTCMISSSYLAGVTAAELRRHLANVNVIEIIWTILLLNQNFP